MAMNKVENLRFLEMIGVFGPLSDFEAHISNMKLKNDMHKDLSLSPIAPSPTYSWSASADGLRTARQFSAGFKPSSTMDWAI